MRIATVAATLLAAGPVLAGRRASFRVGAEVVSSARVVTSAGAAGLGFESRSFGGSAAAVLLEQRRRAPMRLSD